MAMLPEPRSDQLGVMPARVIQYDNHHTVPFVMAQELFQKRKKRRGIKGCFPTHNYSPVLGACSTEHAEALTGGSMKHHRIHILRRHPHGAA